MFGCEQLHQDRAFLSVLSRWPSLSIGHARKLVGTSDLLALPAGSSLRLRCDARLTVPVLLSRGVVQVPLHVGDEFGAIGDHDRKERWLFGSGQLGKYVCVDREACGTCIAYPSYV